MQKHLRRQWGEPTMTNNTAAAASLFKRVQGKANIWRTLKKKIKYQKKKKNLYKYFIFEMCGTSKCHCSSITVLRLAPPSGDTRDKYVACALVRQALMLPHAAAAAAAAATRVCWQDGVSQGHQFLKYQRSLRTNYR